MFAGLKISLQTGAGANLDQMHTLQVTQMGKQAQGPDRGPTCRVRIGMRQDL